MWRLPVCILLLALASAEPQEGFEYLPPRPSGPDPVVCERPVTSVAYTTRVQTSVAVRTSNQVDTVFRTTTLVQREVVPTTIYRTRVVTQPRIDTSVIQSTDVQFRDRVVDQTLPGANIVSTRYETTYRVVPEVSYVTREQVRTTVVPVEITRTVVSTVERINYNYQTQQVQRTNVVTVTGRDVVQTRVQTIRQTSVVQSQPPARTNFITSTRVQQVVNTRTVQGPNQYRTSVVNRQQVIPTTIVSQRVDNRFVTRTNAVTRTSVRYQTNYQTSVVPQEVVSTRIVPTTIYTTRFVTQPQPVTRVETRVVYRTVTPAAVFQTREVTQTSVEQVRGADRVINRDFVQTQQRQQVVYQTVNRPEATTVTRTITSSCSGYNYDAPKIPFNIRRNN
ncbi:unnamed protein product [Meganyctiphanes norvegica]|uniref:Zonadhesin n=1 Tax=Meganyctiphanes norvegica TaxID=48144 RepID=A0AAV2REI5_MEGNR